MKQFIFLFFITLISLLSLSVVIAAGFSPSSLIFELQQGEEDCQTISINSNSETISVSDKWAENKDIIWKTSLFNTTAEEHGILISYPEEISSEEREVDVCLSGSELGEYHGVILLKEEQQGNSIVQMGVWLKVTIIEKEEEEIQQNNNNGGSNVNGGGSGGGGSIQLNTANKTNGTGEDNEGLIENSEEEVEEKENTEARAGITGAVIGVSNKSEKIIGITLIVIGVFSLIVYNKKIRRRKI